MILNKNDPVEKPRKLKVQIKRDQDLENSRVAVNFSWEEVKGADTYEVEIGGAFNSTWSQDKSEITSLGGGDTMGLSITTIENLERGYNYKIKVKSYDCMKRVSEWSSIVVKLTNKGTVAYVK